MAASTYTAPTPGDVTGITDGALRNIFAEALALEAAFDATPEAMETPKFEAMLDRSAALLKRAATMPATSIADAEAKIRLALHRLDGYAYDATTKTALETALAAIEKAEGPAGDDTELLALVERFRRLYATHQTVETEYRILRDKVDAEFPCASCAAGDVYGSPEWAAKEEAQRHALLATGAADMWLAVNHTSHAAGMTLRQIFKTEAHTPAGSLAKVELYRLAYGSEPQGGSEGNGDPGLDAYDVDYWTDWTTDEHDGIHHDDPDWRPWMDTIVADLERLAGTPAGPAA